MKTKAMRLELVELMPSKLESGVLYVSHKYQTAAHLCACGCGEKIRTQLGPLGWRFTNQRQGPSLFPSIGNWQKPCRSHYFIKGGHIVWAPPMSEAEVSRGRKEEMRRRDDFIRARNRGWWGRIQNWFGFGS